MSKKSNTFAGDDSGLCPKKTKIHRQKSYIK